MNRVGNTIYPERPYNWLDRPELMREKLHDPRPGSALISSIHTEPGYSWTLPKLGERAGMSRSIFALSFKASVGVTPTEYLTRWRMMLAADKPMNSRDSISEIAASPGYKSESALGKAFRRVLGCSPRKNSAQPG